MIDNQKTITVEVPVYATVLTSQQMTDLYSAFSKAIFYAKLSGRMNESEISKLDKAYAMFNSITSVGSGKSPEELAQAAYDSFAADCAKFGCD